MKLSGAWCKGWQAGSQPFGDLMLLTNASEFQRHPRQRSMMSEAFFASFVYGLAEVYLACAGTGLNCVVELCCQQN
jgi:hypothetical protein